MENMNNSKENKFYAIIILYNPDSLDLTISNIENLRKSNIHTFIYDNSQNADIRKKNRNTIVNTFNDVHYFDSQGENNGLSYAYNFIIEKLFEEQVDLNSGICFFDQDSEINFDSIASLIQNYLTLLERDDFGFISGFPMRKDGKPYRIREVSPKSNNNHYIEVYQAPSSFSLIPLRTFKHIGLFQKDFFIDHIDMDFSLRCRLAGKKIITLRNATFIHDIGIGNVELGGRFLFPYGHPQRHYYQVRNMILSLKRSHQSNTKIIKETFVRFSIVLITGAFKGNFNERMKFFLKGVKHGLESKGGKL
jgi:rhamnosyltransferase